MAQEIARFYTRSRRFKKMVGRLLDGTPIWGGPYSMPQFGVAGAVLFALLVSKPLWSPDGNLFFEIPMIVGITWGLAFLVGLIPVTRRPIGSWAMGALGAMLKPFEGTVNGSPVRIRSPHYVGGKTAMPLPPSAPAPDRPLEQPTEEAPASVEPEPEISPEIPAAPVPARTPKKPVSAVERLLQQASGK